MPRRFITYLRTDSPPLLVLVADQRKVGVEEIVRLVALSFHRKPDRVHPACQGSVAGHGAVCSRSISKSKNSAPLPVRIEIGRIDPAFSKPRSVAIFRDPANLRVDHRARRAFLDDGRI